MSSRTRRASSRLRRLRTVPVLPTLLTSSNLACGVTAIFCAASQHELLFQGAILIFAAMICDMLDGKVARMTGTTGQFGMELDSLADVVSFGVAPAILVHRTVLGENPTRVWGEGETLIWSVAVLYAVLTAIRLARYNVEHEGENAATDCFIGLPSPGAASVLCAWVMFAAWFENPVHWSGSMMDQMGMDPTSFHAAIQVILLVMTPILALLMVSKIKFPHVGNTLLGDGLGFRRFILLILLITMLFTAKFYGVVLLVTAYVLIGLIPGVPQVVRRWRSGRDILEEDDDDEADEDSAPSQA
ncbi:MAG: CDP-alcohol phosphatidyltransferase family protein [Planctomycetota bacterium]|nr:CDP-alcohol phosphatidyltransferase family protein [Planctomycetota bacterium]